MSTFDEAAFMQTETTEQGSTAATPVPENEYVAVIKDAKPRPVKDDRMILDVQWAIDDPEATKATGIPFPTVRQSIWLDMAGVGLDMGKGKNVALNRLREAVGQNIAGKVWKPTDLIGQVARITVKHRIAEENVYADVKAVAKA